MRLPGAPAASDLLAQLRAAALRFGTHPQPAAEGLPAGFGNLDDVILLVQPLRLNATTDDEIALKAVLQRAAEKNFLTGSQAVGEGGIGLALLAGSLPRGFGFRAELTENEGTTAPEALFAKHSARALVSTRPKAHLPLANFVERSAQFTADAIARVTDGEVRVRWMGAMVIELGEL